MFVAFLQHVQPLTPPMNPLVLRIVKIHADAIVPHYAHPGDAGMDVYSIEDVRLAPGARALVHTGLTLAVPEGYEAQVRPKSGLALQHGITLLNTPGTIDSGFRGELGVIVINHGQAPFEIRKQMKIAQLVICPVLRVEVVETTTLDDTARGAGGFGSTGLTRTSPAG